MRLQHYLAQAGLGSRRHCEKLISAGRVRVNGAVVSQLGTKLNPEYDEASVDGRVVAIEEKFYVLLNKPRRCLSSVVDKRGRPTVSDFVKDVPARLYPVGRLDMDTEGVLLMTNDGLFCHRMTHPRFEIEKTYRAEVRGRPSQRVLSTLERGVNIDNGVTFPAKVKQISSTHNRTTLEITVHEGRKRQIKKMCAAVGHRVVKLKRVEFCGIRLGNLQPGQYRFLSKEEVAMLARKVGLD